MKKNVLFTLLFITTSLFAEIYESKGVFENNPLGNVEGLEIVGDEVKCNNFSLSEESGSMMLYRDMAKITLTGSVKNKKDRGANVVMSMIGYDEEGITLWVINAVPEMGAIGRNKTGTLKGSVFVQKGTLQATTRISYKLLGN